MSGCQWMSELLRLREKHNQGESDNEDERTKVTANGWGRERVQARERKQE